ncbi:MAG: phosphate ABC transporter substrate-binding protein PstS [Betaproteobacteria bacterium]|nr:phosphate ABC transporter substrate-binding protein PstS [Betaproteobacteria bacterium]
MINLTTSRTLLTALALGSALMSVAHAGEMTGAGSTFGYPIYAKWAEAYKASSGVSLNYQSIGSGGGIKQIEANTVDFGATDMPLSPETLAKNGLTQFPTVIGGVVPVVNIPGVAPGKMHLNGKTLSDIYMGKVIAWNDPEIVALNKGLTLPATHITVVHRSDGSGTTFIFTNYLSKISPDWKEKVGNDTAVAWPAGVGGKGNEGVASFVKQIRGSVGYVEYAYAKQNKMAYVLMQNKAGQYVAPFAANIQAAAAGADWAHVPDFYEILTNEPGMQSWPITGATFILMHKTASKPENAKIVLKFFDWAYVNGGQLATSLDYVTLPNSVTKLIETSWTQNIRDNSGKAIW